MSSDISLVEFIVDQISSAGIIRYKKMFGEYGIYCDDKFIALVCNNKYFVKATVDIKKLIKQDSVIPYKGGGKGYWHVDETIIDDKDTMVQLAKAASNFVIKSKKL
jgi:TfoX/Sxy family transcriptional regulator of competence genes